MPRSLAVPYPKKGIYHCGCATPPWKKRTENIISLQFQDLYDGGVWCLDCTNEDMSYKVLGVAEWTGPWSSSLLRNILFHPQCSYSLPQREQEGSHVEKPSKGPSWELDTGGFCCPHLQGGSPWPPWLHGFLWARTQPLGSSKWTMTHSFNLLLHLRNNILV